mmetsp:Transcript_32875/g.73757  ORF Transcript_32875/g.73757 Transcript_32875/m.73757 type:complete len:241 (-) Transcript_32875:231-953(-)
MQEHLAQVLHGYVADIQRHELQVHKAAEGGEQLFNNGTVRIDASWDCHLTLLLDCFSHFRRLPLLLFPQLVHLCLHGTEEVACPNQGGFNASTVLAGVSGRRRALNAWQALGVKDQLRFCDWHLRGVFNGGRRLLKKLTVSMFLSTTSLKACKAGDVKRKSCLRAELPHKLPFRHSVRGARGRMVSKLGSCLQHLQQRPAQRHRISHVVFPHRQLPSAAASTVSPPVARLQGGKKQRKGG